MRYREFIGANDDVIEHRSIKPKFYPCPQCGKKGRRKRVIHRQISHVSALHRRSGIFAEVGVYQSRCRCCQYFQSPIPGVPYKGQYSYEVRNTVANALIRDRQPYRLVMERMPEDYRLQLSLGYLHQCFLWAHEQIDMEDHWNFVWGNFSGVLCLDEVHDSGRTILFATDPLNDFTASFELVEKNDQAHMDQFLQRLKDRGLKVEVVITDGSPLYKDSWQSYWKDVVHQLCVFDVIKEVNKLILDGVRAVKNRIKRQGKKGRKKRRGRSTERIQKHRTTRKQMNQKEQAAFIWKHQYLIVRKQEDRSEQEIEDLDSLLEMAPELEVFRKFNRQFYGLFQKNISQHAARNRRTRMLNHLDYQNNSFLQRAWKNLKKEKFEKMIAFLAFENVDCTNNHVEKNNRSFRMLQKTRYKRRTQHMIQKALELNLYARMLKHPLFQKHGRTCELHYAESEEAPLKMAA